MLMSSATHIHSVEIDLRYSLGKLFICLFVFGEGVFVFGVFVFLAFQVILT